MSSNLASTMNLNQAIKPEHSQVTFRGTVAGLAIGTLILLSNFQFGLQTGWVSMMSLPAALMAFSIFKTFDSYSPLSFPFTPQENVYVQSVAVAVATGPLAYGFIGIIPAIEKLLTPEEAGVISKVTDGLRAVFEPFKPSYKLLIWSLGLAFFGVFFAVPLREEFIVRQKLQFPSGSATATLISVFHRFPLRLNSSDNEENNMDNQTQIHDVGFHDLERDPNKADEEAESYSRDMLVLSSTAMISAIYTLTSYFIPQIKIIPVLGNYLSNEYLINFTPSPAYIGQGIIMGFETTCGMFLGMILGWFILSPYAKYMGWAPGETGDWKNGSEGWIMWISLSIMISDSVVSLGLMNYRLIISYLSYLRNSKRQSNIESSSLLQSIRVGSPGNNIHNGDTTSTSNSSGNSYMDADETAMTNAPQNNNEDIFDEETINYKVPVIGLLLCIPMLIISMKFIFGNIVPAWILLLTIPISLVLSLVGVKSLGETDLNPVSGIGKLSQLMTALVVPSSTPGAVLINLVVGAISEATAQQAGDLMQDLKTGYLLHGSPQAQFIAQIFGSIWGVLIATPMYRWYDKIYQIPGPLFKIPTAVIWIDCARLVNGHELPEKVGLFVIIFGILSFVLSLIRGIVTSGSRYYKYTRLIPSGVSVGIGIYNTPSFTLARFLGGLISWYWIRRLANRHSSLVDSGKVSLIIFSSGLVLGEGLFSVVNMILASLGVPHL